MKADLDRVGRIMIRIESSGMQFEVPAVNFGDSHITGYHIEVPKFDNVVTATLSLVEMGQIEQSGEAHVHDRVCDVKFITPWKTVKEKMYDVRITLSGPAGGRVNYVYVSFSCGDVIVVNKETPVVETPVVETPVVETPVVETPVVETSVVETSVVETSVVV